MRDVNISRFSFHSFIFIFIRVFEPNLTPQVHWLLTKLYARQALSVGKTLLRRRCNILDIGVTLYVHTCAPYISSEGCYISSEGCAEDLKHLIQLHTKIVCGRRLNQV